MPRVDAMMAQVRALLREQLTSAGGSNDTVSLSEQGAMGSGVAQDAVIEVRTAGGAGTRVSVEDAFVRADARATAAIDLINGASGQSTANLSKTEILTLAATDRPVAELCVRAWELLGGAPIELPADTSAGAVPRRKPGRALGRTNAELSAAIDTALPAMKRLVRAADFGRNGTITYGEAKSFANAFLPRDAATPDDFWGFGRAIWEARQDVWRATGKSRPTIEEVEAALEARVVIAKTYSVADNGALLDASGTQLNGSEDPGTYWIAAAVHEGLDAHNEPYVRFLDHEGDVEESKRVPLDLTGPAADAIRQLVFHFNIAENDNHWPRWSGRVASRYKLGEAEGQAVADAIRAEPPARAAELVQALADWIHQAGPGLVYLEDPARVLIEQLAADLGVTADFVGVRTAPVLDV
jgi:hypothetical protein